MARARGPSARVVMNRQAIDQVQLAVGDGVLAVAEEIVRVATPPDATPFGEGLVDRGGWLGYVGSKKIGGGSLDGRQPKKPRSLRVRGSEVIVAIAGWGFPGRFQELGTAHHAAQPFATPARDRVAPRAPRIMADQVPGSLRGIR